MGYNTSFTGTLKFRIELKASDLAYLQKFLGEDARDHEDWPKTEWYSKLPSFIDLELTPEFDGLQWNGAEKTYQMVEQVNYIISLGFPLEGELLAQGEEVGDVWKLVIGEDGIAAAVELSLEVPKEGQFTADDLQPLINYIKARATLGCEGAEEVLEEFFEKHPIG